MRGALVAILLAAMVVVAAGCGIGLGDAVPSTSCENVPSAACSEQAQRLAVGLTGIDSVYVQCGEAAPCTRAGGSGLAEIRFTNGQKVSRPWSYVGDSGPPPVVTCVGLAQVLCISAMGSETDLVSPSRHIAAVTVTCSSTACTEAEGSATVHIVLGDGSVEDHGSSWTSH